MSVACDRFFLLCFRRFFGTSICISMNESSPSSSPSLSSSSSVSSFPVMGSSITKSVFAVEKKALATH